MDSIRTTLAFALICVLSGAPVRAQADDSRGITPALVYDGAGFANLAGGLKRSGTYSGNLNLRLTLDLDTLMGWPGVLFYVDGLWIHGGQPSTLVGDAQGVSNISAPAAAQIEELWLQKTYLDRQLSALVGLYDLNSEFYRLQSAGLFLNSSFGIGPEFSQSGLAGPSIFPATSVGMRFAYKPNPGVVVRAAILDGVPVKRPGGTDAVFQPGDGALLVSEAAFLTRPAANDHPSSQRLRLGRFAMLSPYDDKLAIGAWHYTASHDDPSETAPDGQPVRRRGGSGAYLVADHLVSRDDADADKRTAAFLQLGFGDPGTYRFGSYVGAGLVRSGVFGGAATEQLGLGVAVARNGSRYLDRQRAQGIPVRRSETSIELAYLRQVTPWLAVEPDLQYVIRPDTDPTIRNALAFTLRFELAVGP